MRKTLVTVIVAIVAVALVFGLAYLLGFGIGKAVDAYSSQKEKTYSLEGLSITLPGEFVKARDNSITQAGNLATDDVSFVVIRDAQSFENYKDVAEYAVGFKEANRYEEEIKTENGYTLIEYYRTISGVNTQNTVVLLHGPDAFWVLRFSFDKALCEEYRPRIFEWLNTVTFETK